EFWPAGGAGCLTAPLRTPARACHPDGGEQAARRVRYSTVHATSSAISVRRTRSSPSSPTVTDAFANEQAGETPAPTARPTDNGLRIRACSLHARSAPSAHANRQWRAVVGITLPPTLQSWQGRGRIEVQHNEQHFEPDFEQHFKQHFEQHFKQHFKRHS